MSGTTKGVGAIAKVKRRRIDGDALAERLREVQVAADAALESMTEAMDRESRRRALEKDSRADRGLQQRFGGGQR